MREGFAHEALVIMAPGADLAAPGAAITVSLCGHWEHRPPCPLAPHHTSAERLDDQVRLTILFATEPDLEQTVRQGIDRALSGGGPAGPDGATWHLRLSRRRDPSPGERAHLARLARS